MTTTLSYTGPPPASPLLSHANSAGALPSSSSSSMAYMPHMQLNGGGGTASPTSPPASNFLAYRDTQHSPDGGGSEIGSPLSYAQLPPQHQHQQHQQQQSTPQRYASRYGAATAGGTPRSVANLGT